ncbi:MAG: alpha/beta fold hydrolase [Planctomycetes bacterium]|nr:alpha/beta fold hydrolase [Planctomycetota bacterium]
MTWGRGPDLRPLGLRRGDLRPGLPPAARLLAVRQAIRFATTGDGVRLAWAQRGNGPPLVRASNWLTHIDYDLESPVWRHWIEFLTGHFGLLRYDERGCGMSDWKVADLSCSRWIEDLEAVVDAARPRTPFALLGISQGAATAIQYAVRHPEHVSHLILYGGYAAGWRHRDDPAALRAYESIVELMRHGWGKENPVFRQLFTARFVPGGSAEQLQWFNELCRRTTEPEVAAALLEARAEVDVRKLLPAVQTPTLVLHATGDQVSPLANGHLLAQQIPGAEFVPLPSDNHVLLAEEPAWEQFREAVLEFTGRGALLVGKREAAVFRRLTQREREILAGICAGYSNAGIGKRLFIAEKTVRNHVTRLFEKLGVHSRTEAVICARDGGFGD